MKEMKVKELIKKLESCDEDDEVFFNDDGFIIPINSLEKVTTGLLTTEILLKNEW